MSALGCRLPVSTILTSVLGILYPATLSTYHWESIRSTTFHKMDITVEPVLKANAGPSGPAFRSSKLSSVPFGNLTKYVFLKPLFNLHYIPPCTSFPKLPSCESNHTHGLFKIISSFLMGWPQASAQLIHIYIHVQTSADKARETAPHVLKS